MMAAAEKIFSLPAAGTVFPAYQLLCPGKTGIKERFRSQNQKEEHPYKFRTPGKDRKTDRIRQY